MVRISFLLALAASVLSLAGARAEEDDLGQDVYNSRCASCHGRDGKARTDIGRKLKAKDLTQATTWQGLTDNAIEKQILAGTPDKSMPPYQGRLSAEELAAVIKYLHEFKPK